MRKSVEVVLQQNCVKPSFPVFSSAYKAASAFTVEEKTFFDDLLRGSLMGVSRVWKPQSLLNVRLELMENDGIVARTSDGHCTCFGGRILLVISRSSCQTDATEVSSRVL